MQTQKNLVATGAVDNAMHWDVRFAVGQAVEIVVNAAIENPVSRAVSRAGGGVVSRTVRQIVGGYSPHPALRDFLGEVGVAS